ncbi:MAG: Gfo/Idh/MocA family oxidoreductase [Candidatus Omnitrophica bacterium]|nr:Gfo/Idh/MocA family oxidoreductase [Candidatus Omnitrophota bacterium]
MNKNIAVVGAGYWGKNLIRNFASLGALLLICEKDSEKIAPFKEKYPQVETTASFEEVLKNKAVKGVVLATPAESHFRLGKEVLNKGKDLFVEKPLSLSVREGEGLVNLAKEKSSVLMVGHLLQYHPGIIKLKEIIQKGELGKICYIYSNRVNLGKFRTEENILWSFAPHDISVILYLLGEEPERITAVGSAYLNPEIVDITVTNLQFKTGVAAHIFVSWLHPYKEQKLIVVGDKGMVLFDDLAENKLTIFRHRVEWKQRIPTPKKKEGELLPFRMEEPLRLECSCFLECIKNRTTPQTDGEEGLKVLKVLEAAENSLAAGGIPISPSPLSPPLEGGEDRGRGYFTHPTAVIEEPCEIGEGTKIWHFSHIMENSKIGKNCNIGGNVVISPKVIIGNNVKIQNNVSVYTGVTLEDNVFCGPSMVFTNVINPRAHIIRRNQYQKTLVKKGATLGANCTIVCGHTIGKYAFVGAGAVVTKDIPDYGLYVGVPAKSVGWVCQCGERLNIKGKTANCKICGSKYKLGTHPIFLK